MNPSFPSSSTHHVHPPANSSNSPHVPWGQSLHHLWLCLPCHMWQPWEPSDLHCALCPRLFLPFWHGGARRPVCEKGRMSQYLHPPPGDRPMQGSIPPLLLQFNFWTVRELYLWDIAWWPTSVGRTASRSLSAISKPLLSTISFYSEWKGSSQVDLIHCNCPVWLTDTHSDKQTDYLTPLAQAHITG